MFEPYFFDNTLYFLLISIRWDETILDWIYFFKYFFLGRE